MTETKSDLSAEERERAASLFKAYDIRGVVPDELTPEIARQIGRALVATLQPDTVVVGRDMRVSSPLAGRSLIEGIRDAGADVVDIGMVSTDALYFAVGKYGYPGRCHGHRLPQSRRSTTASRSLARRRGPSRSTRGSTRFAIVVLANDLPPVKPASERGSLATARHPR